MKRYLWILFLGTLSCTQAQKKTSPTNEVASNTKNKTNMDEIITLGGGCFWCTEAVFQRLEGVDTVISGYMGGHVKNPSYKEVCTGTTGHAEVIQVHYDPQKISLTDILEVFFTVHDPTTLNRQGADVGTQYRSVIFYENASQKTTAENVISTLQNSKIFEQPIVTELSPATPFYPAEDYHQNYYNLNSNQPYCSFVISPKIQKIEKLFKDKLK